MSYVVTAPYVTVKVGDGLGSMVLKGFYRGGTLPADTDQGDLDRHLRKGMIAKAGTPEAEGVAPVGERVEFDEHGGPKPAVPAKPTPKPPVKAAPAKA
ncbi:hypothetical protein ACFQS1_19750 [Paractinoplanes rhizophilus]|uniref:Uncharacterized protein n=1 Tax=Paractinoplanes rhizophilus TaxID=1416877 RepID=A0ABW2HSU2_9ACTN